MPVTPMSGRSWAAMTELAAAQRDFMNDNVAGLQAPFSYGYGRYGGFERSWVEVGPRLA
jgi:hypothetical protein